MHPYKVDKRAWRDNDNCISLDAEYAIDVPKASASLSAYCATLVLSLALSHSLFASLARAAHSLCLCTHYVPTHRHTPQGHKANHAFANNAEYVPVYHPRFGHIKGIRAVKPIAAGSEVLVNYGYTSQMPKWYRELHQALQKP